MHGRDVERGDLARELAQRPRRRIVPGGEIVREPQQHAHDVLLLLRHTAPHVLQRVTSTFRRQNAHHGDGRGGWRSSRYSRS